MDEQDFQELDDIEDEVISILKITKNTAEELEKGPALCDMDTLQALGVDFATSLEKVRLGMIDAIDTIYPHDLNQDENGNNDEAIAEMVKSIDNQIKEIQKKFDDFDNDD